jgi:ABC-type Fe3+-siderophore transport system permease subunit
MSTDEPSSTSVDPYRLARNRVWPHEVAVGVTALRGELHAILGRDPRGSEVATHEELTQIGEGVSALLDRAEDAAAGRSPRYRFLRSWWHGNVIEAAFQNLHRAEAEIVLLYDDAEVDAAVPEAVARLCSGLTPGDSRVSAAVKLTDKDAHAGRHRRLLLRKTIQIGHEVKDQQFARIRKFRNIVLLSAALIFAFVVAFSVVVTVNPAAVPFCFPADGGAGAAAQHCATHEGAPGSLDIWIVGLLGLLGGSLAAAVAIRSIRGTPSPYNLAIALALLKVPTGALTAIGALIALNGDFVPGFTALDSQGQILAYALVFGYAQQLLTGLIDRRALELVSSVPNKNPDPPAARAATQPRPA